jgi:hypothetical protein
VSGSTRPQRPLRLGDHEVGMHLAALTSAVASATTSPTSSSKPNTSLTVSAWLADCVLGQADRMTFEQAQQAIGCEWIAAYGPIRTAGLGSEDVGSP